MNKKIKVIDLLNKIANGEEIPKRIEYSGETYHPNIFRTYYFSDDNSSQLNFDNLNDYVKILEDNIEEIDELEISNNMATDERLKINELVRAVNQLIVKLENK